MPLTPNQERIKELIEDEYLVPELDSNASQGFYGALRDFLTDLQHVADTKGLDIRDRIEDAMEVYFEEKAVEQGHEMSLQEEQEVNHV